jgi:two-component system, cell cycle sensor histidine kinase and response regulator CckA
MGAFRTSRMSQDPERPSVPSEWRELAEQKRRSQPPDSGHRRSRVQTERLLEELKVHEIELEMQNDALLASRAEVEVSLERYTDLYDFAPVGYFALAADGGIRGLNLSGARLLGLERARLIGRQFRRYVSLRDRSIFDSWLEGVFAIPPSAACVVALSRDGQRARAVQIEATLSPDGLEARALVTDITARQALEDQLRQAQKMELVGQLAGGVAHDFNNILAAMTLNLDLLRRQRQLPDEARAPLHDLDVLTKRASSLTGQLLLFSRQQTMQTIKVEINAALTHLLKMLERTLGEEICFVRLGDALELWVDSDVAMLEQAIMNVCLNARDAMPNGGTLTLEASAVDFGLEDVPSEPEARPGSFVCLRITDTGCGMGSDVLRHLFEPFFTTKEVGKGTGLGLASAFGIAHQHSGWLGVESGVGQGSTFRFYLPRSARAKPARSAESPAPVARRTRHTILLVEDEPELLRASARALTQLGYRVLSASDGQEALKVWTQSRIVIDLLLADMRMPKGISGLQLAERLWETKPSLKVVIMSGYNTEIAANRDSAARRYTFLPKPFDLATLDQALR